MNEIMKNFNKIKQVCTRCIQDETVPGISFDDNGVCNYCHLHDELCEMFPNDERGTQKLNKIIEDIKKQSKNKEFDCVVGISGGRDSMYLLYNAVKIWKLRVLAVHSDDWFDNPIAVENMKKAVEKLKVNFITVKYPLELACDIKKSLIKASVPELILGTDISIANSLYSTAYKYKINNILLGHSFRTEGVKPLEWYFCDGKYLKSIHNKFGTIRIPKWMPENPTYNLGIKELFFYIIVKRIQTRAPLFYMNYIRKEAEEIIKTELDWIYPGAHYFDYLYYSFISYIHRVKFHINLNINSDAALVRDGQMTREEGLKRLQKPYHLEDNNIVDFCLKKLNVSQKEFDEIIKLPLKTFRDYNTSYNMIRMLKYPLKILSIIDVVPKFVYKKYFEF